MSHRRSLDSVRRLSRERERSAARALGEAQRRLETQEALLRQLCRHRDDYRGRFLRQGVGGMGAAQLLQYRQFLARLDLAIEQQRVRVEEHRRTCEHSRQHWLECRSHLKAVGKLAERRALVEAHLQARREQAETDDGNSRRPPPDPFLR